MLDQQTASEVMAEETSSKLPVGWSLTTLEVIVDIRDDLRQPINAEERAKRVGPYPYYGATGQVGWIDGYLMDGEYILLGEDGAPFLDPVKPKAYIVSGKSWVNNHAHVLRAKPCLASNRFVLFALNATDYVDFVNGTTRLKLTQGALKSIPIRLPPLREQERIVAAIETQFTRLDAAIVGLKGVQVKLKRYRAAVLKAAVEGTLTEVWRAGRPDVEPAADLLGRILHERRAAWEQAESAKYAKAGKTPPKGWQAKYKEPAEPDTSELPGLPTSWTQATVEQLLLEPASNGISVKGSSAPPGIPALRLSAMSSSGFDYKDRRYIPISLEAATSLAIHEGDYFVSRGNGSLHLVGRGTLAQEPSALVFANKGAIGRALVG